MLIVRKQNLWNAVDKLKALYEVQQIIVLKSSHEQYQDFFFIVTQMDIQNVDFEEFIFTIVHKKGRCYFTINALNELILEKNDGVLDKTFIIDWDEYQNSILFLNKDKQLVVLPTKLYKLIRQNKNQYKDKEQHYM